MEPEVVTNPTDAPIEIIPDTEPEGGSIADHAKQFGPQATKEAEPEPEKKADDLKPIRPVDQQKREGGKFAEGKTRMRAKDAVTRINELTGRAKAAEEAKAATETKLAAAERELAEIRARGGSKTEERAAERKVERAEAAVEEFTEPEPKEDDPKFEGDYGKFLTAVAERAGRKAYYEQHQKDRQAAETARRRETEQATLKDWATRVDAVRAKHADFDQVALKTPASWLDKAGNALPDAVMIDAFIMEDDAGPEVLYYLAQHPAEVDSLRRMAPTQQLRWLVAKATELSPAPAQAGTTGAAAGTKKPVVLPTPPTPVRTSAQSATDEPPPTDGSLSIAEHRKRFGPKR